MSNTCGLHVVFVAISWQANPDSTIGASTQLRQKTKNARSRVTGSDPGSDPRPSRVSELGSVPGKYWYIPASLYAFLACSFDDIR